MASGAPWVPSRQRGPPGPFRMALGTGSDGSLALTRLQDFAAPNELLLNLAVLRMKPSRERKCNIDAITVL